MMRKGLIISTALFIFSLVMFFCHIASAGLQFYYIGQYEWVETTNEEGQIIDATWDAPLAEKRTGSLDFRNRANRTARGGVAGGYAIFSYSEFVEHPKLTYLGNDLDEKPNVKATGAIKSKLGVDVTTDTIREMIYELRTTHADPTGVDGWKPARPLIDGTIKTYLGDEEINSVKITAFVSPEWKKIQLAIQNDYKEMLKTENYDAIAKWLDYQEERYGVHYTNFIPDGEIKLASLPHETDIADDWDTCANADNPDCLLDWTELGTQTDWDIVSNFIQQTDSFNGPYVLRADSDLSSADQYARGTILSATNNDFTGPIVRKDSTTTLTYYGCATNEWPGSDADISLRIYEAGSPTTIDSLSNYGSCVNCVVELTVQGDALSCEVDNVEILSGTNGTISGGLRTGLYVTGSGSTANKGSVDDFAAGDLASGGFTPEDIKIFNDMVGTNIYVN